MMCTYRRHSQLVLNINFRVKLSLRIVKAMSLVDPGVVFSVNSKK